MEQEPILEKQIPTGKIFKNKAIDVATYLGGPLVAGYLIAENFKVFNEPEKAKKTWIYSIITTIIIFVVIFSVPDIDKIPRELIPLIYTAIAYFLVKHFQGEKIEAHIVAGGQIHTWGRTILVGIIGLAVILIVVFAVVILSGSSTDATITTKSYGLMKHEIDFDKTNISENDVDKLADGLRQATFFDDTNKKFVFAKKVGNNYELSISCNKTIKDNPDAINWFIQLRKDLQKLYPNNKIIFNLVVNNLDNVVKRLE